jgi:hypothetical protein
MKCYIDNSMRLQSYIPNINSGDGRCCMPMGVAVWPGASGCFELGWAQPVKGKDPVVPCGLYCTSGPA